MTRNVFTMVGKVCSDPSLRLIGEEKTPVVKFRMVSTRRRFDIEANEWVECDHIWVTAEAWETMAEHVYKSIEKGMKVVAQGVLRSEEYRDEAGIDRTAINLRLNHLGPDIRHYNITAHRLADREVKEES